MIQIGQSALSLEDQSVVITLCLEEPLFLGNLKQKVTISLSLVEAEYRSMRRVKTKLSWLSRLFAELDVQEINLCNVPKFKAKNFF